MNIEITDGQTVTIKIRKDNLRQGINSENIDKIASQLLTKKQGHWRTISVFKRGIRPLYENSLTIKTFVEEKLVSIYTIDIEGGIYATLDDEWTDPVIFKINAMALRVILQKRFRQVQDFAKSTALIGRILRKVRFTAAGLSALLTAMGILRNNTIYLLTSVISLLVILLFEYFFKKYIQDHLWSGL